MTDQANDIRNEKKVERIGQNGSLEEWNVKSGTGMSRSSGHLF
jgi:hypothetical protein